LSSTVYVVLALACPDAVHHHHTHGLGDFQADDE